MLRVNVGCGPAPTPGWANVDNSLSLLVPRPLVAPLERLRIVKPSQADVAKSAAAGVRRGRAGKLPFADASADAVYTSHMLEHLSRSEARRFLLEARRILVPGGHLRIVVPDLRGYVRDYLASGDADALVANLRMADEERGLRRLVAGFRGHRWMYDSTSLRALVASAGFTDVVELEPGETRIPAPGELDLREREGDSVYIEALRSSSG